MLARPALRDGFQSWEALSAAGLPDYLRAAGVIQEFEAISTSRSPGRNRVHRVCRSGKAHPSWFVKQFGFGDYDGAAFEREREVTTWPNSRLILSPVLVDDTWRVLVFPAFGESLYEMVRSGVAILPEIGSTLSRELRALQAHAAATPLDLPPILRWLTGGSDDADLSIAQRRLATTLRHNPSVKCVAERASKVWRAGESQSVLCHGDLKLEHVLVSVPRGECRCVDWEFARSGPAEWDFAGLLQSVLAHVVFDLITWSPDVRDLLVELLVDVDTESPEFAALVALRLWQTAIEWETGQVQLSNKSGPLCQLGVNLACDPGQIDRLLRSGI